MKKHILGLGIFSFIFASFTLAFAYFYAAPLPQIAEVNQEVRPQPDAIYGKTSCFRSKRKDLSSEIISSQLFLDENKIISKVKISWNGMGKPPEKVGLILNFSALEGKEKSSFSAEEVFDDPFRTGTKKVFTVISKISDEEKFSKEDNIYVVSGASDYYLGSKHQETSAGTSEPKAVVISHGERSVIGK